MIKIIVCFQKYKIIINFISCILNVDKSKLMEKTYILTKLVQRILTQDCLDYEIGMTMRKKGIGMGHEKDYKSLGYREEGE